MTNHQQQVSLSYADAGKEGAFSQDDFTPDAFDTYLNAELLLSNSDNNVV
jgi:hypothetical protein